ncbi:hypothetical protein NQ176_g9177 [Zarea fungicola]|uniref:Uncharacterized protein n=1 Tax=Zarea fungicola TaxID=93591 RepID=A0ACC1MP88_9HYPO|nr:hypothetical protein NQ176_g9177 [Lecanicillium fungicola]
MNNAKIRSLPDGSAQVARDAQIIKSTRIAQQDLRDVTMDMAADQNSPQFMKWVREYDVVSEASKLLRGAPF